MLSILGRLHILLPVSNITLIQVDRILQIMENVLQSARDLHLEVIHYFDC